MMPRSRSSRSNKKCSTCSPKVGVSPPTPRPLHQAISASFTPREYSSSILGSPQYNASNTDTSVEPLDVDDETSYDDWTDLTLPTHITNILAQYPHKHSNKSAKSTRNNDDDHTSVNRHKNTLFAYSPHHNYKTQNFMTISRHFTQNIVPNKVSFSIANVYAFLNKSSVMVHCDGNVVYFNRNSRSRVIYNYDFCDKQTGETLYCVADRKWSKKNRHYHYEMRDALFTQRDIQQQFTNGEPKSLHLPPSSRPSYDTVLHEKQAIEEKLHSCIMDVICKVKWKRVRVFNATFSDNKQCRAQYNTTRLTFYIKTDAFDDIIHQSVSELNGIALIPIIMFVADGQCCDYRVEYVQIIRIADNIDIGVSYAYDACNELKVTGIHVNKCRIMDQHQLIAPNHRCQCLDRFESQIDDIHIGNPDDDLNRFKDIKRRMQCKDNAIQQLQRKVKALEIQLSLKNINNGATRTGAHVMASNPNSPRNANLIPFGQYIKMYTLPSLPPIRASPASAVNPDMYPLCIGWPNPLQPPPPLIGPVSSIGGIANGLPLQSTICPLAPAPTNYPLQLQCATNPLKH